VGFGSSGKAHYETDYNSGLGSNGLTSARHDVLDKYYAGKYPETFEGILPEEVVYIGQQKMTDEIAIEGFGNITAGKLLLSPTRTYAPLMKILLEEQFDALNGVIHCSGGGQTKCMKYLPKNLKIVKDNLFDIPPIFELIQKNSGADEKEMYQVFNMGHRLEIFTNEKAAQKMIETANSLGIEAKIVGYTEASDKKELHLKTLAGWITY
jgi:phosphoribosylformylglycinamidine cyclo-ligase